MKVSDIMTREVRFCRLGESLNAAAQTMWELTVGCLPVVDRDGCVVGMLTDRDVSMGAYTTGQRLTDIPVETAMAHKVIACRESESIAAVEALMREHRVRRLPVVDEARRLLGIVSVGDLAKHLEPSFDSAGRELCGDAVAMTLAASSDHPPRPSPVH